MSGLDKLDIPKLTKMAESGDGCALREAVENLFYEERLSVLKKIEEQNKVNRAADPGLPELKSFPTFPETFCLGGVNLWASVDKKGFLQADTVIYKDRFVVTNGTHISYCENLDLKNGTKLKTDGKPPRWFG